jgi:hypothetical protein
MYRGWVWCCRRSCECHDTVRFFNHLVKIGIGEFCDGALEGSESILGCCICTRPGNDGNSDVFLVLMATGDLGGISGAEAGSLWEGETGETFEHGALPGRLLFKDDDLYTISTIYLPAVAHKPGVALLI